MTKFDIIREVFRYQEVTITMENRAYLNKYVKSTYEIPFTVVKSLIEIGSLQKDSGNFETGEEHYRFYDIQPCFLDQVNLDPLTPLLREIRLNKLI